MEHTKRVVVLEDSDVLHLSGGSYAIYNAAQAAGGEEAEQQAVPRELMTLQVRRRRKEKRRGKEKRRRKEKCRRKEKRRGKENKKEEEKKTKKNKKTVVL